MRNEEVLIRFRKCIMELRDLNNKNVVFEDLDITDEIDRLDIVLEELYESLNDVT